jgi:hypothetical protein
MLGIPSFALPSEVVAKLEIEVVEVKRPQSLEESSTRPYPSFESLMMTRRFSPLPAPIFALATFVAAITAVSCGDLTGVPASLPTITDSGVVYAINGAPLGAPTALQISTGALVPANSSFSFDIAFDIDTAGHVLFMPLRTVASALAPTHSVGLQVSQATFDNQLAAPKSGYRADTTLVGATGVVVLAQANDATTCGFAISGQNLYAKVLVNSVDLATRSMKVTFTVDPNCGFVSFAEGVPKN